MSAYSSITIDGVDVIFDPDTLSINTGNLIGINKSMGGTTYTTAVNTNSSSYNRTISIGGAILPTTQATSLFGISAKKTAVLVGGGIIGTSGYFIITSMSLAPIKPRFDIPGDSSVKYTYSVNLTEVDPA